jgi:hypothetical protein
VQKISSEECNEWPRITVVMSEGDRIGTDMGGSRMRNG